jgi:dTDP-4-dehydrorhamnose 3,5-epimerase
LLSFGRGSSAGYPLRAVAAEPAKYVTCVSGSVLDVVVDIRVGSPTFGRWDSVLLDDEERRTVYIAEGLGHAFMSLKDDSVVMYLCSSGYSPDREHTINASDPALGIRWPSIGTGPIVSDRDASAATLAEVQREGLLPPWADCQEFVNDPRRLNI